MTIPAGHTRVVLSGEAPGGEIFQWGFWCEGTAGDAPAAASLAEDLRDLWNDPDVVVPIVSLLKNDSKYTSLKVYCYPLGGPTATTVGEAILAITDGNQGSGSGNAPLYQCMVVSTHTGFSGRTHNGRFYLPTNGTALDTNHRYATADITTRAAAVKKFFDSVNALGGGTTLTVEVLSQKDGAGQPVRRISIDSKPDVQRRRENRMSPGANVSSVLA